MVAIRLSRTGAKKKPSYRVVVMDKRRARDSRNIEIVGHYNPRHDPIELVLKRERITYWLAVGAQPSTTVQRLVKYYDEKVVPFLPVEDQVGTVPAEPEAAAPSESEARSDLPVQPGDPLATGPEGESDDQLDDEIEAALAEDAPAQLPVASTEPPARPDAAAEVPATEAAAPATDRGLAGDDNASAETTTE